MTNDSARAYIALAVEVEEVRQEVASAQARVASDPSDRAAALELRQQRELLERLEFAAGVFMRLLQGRNAPVDNERNAPVDNERNAPIDKERNAPIDKERNAPLDKERNAPLEKERNAPVDRNLYQSADAV